MSSIETAVPRHDPDRPLFYRNPVPLDAQAHDRLGISMSTGMRFAAEAHAVPLTLLELPQACQVYPVVFTADEQAVPMALTGLRPGENLFVDSAGQWQRDAFMPAYVRRYPFIFRQKGADEFALCAEINEETFDVRSPDKLFENGQPTDLARHVLEFCRSYESAARATAVFSKALRDAGLLTERQAELDVMPGYCATVSGFRVIDEDALARVPDDAFLAWRRNGWLPSLYAQILSAAQWQRLTSMLADRLAS